MMMVSPESHLAPVETSPDVHSPGHRTPLTDAVLAEVVCICENAEMLADHINTLEVKLPKQFMGVIKPKVIKFSTQYPDNVTQEG